MIWIELAILLACILVGARLGGIALGTVAGIGLVVFVFVFGMPPGGPPEVVIGMIIAVITALATMQAAGGLDYLVSLAERIMRRHPEYVTFIAPVVTYLLVRCSRRCRSIKPEQPGSESTCSIIVSCCPGWSQ